MRRTLIAGNWKMNGSLAANETLLAGLKQGATARSSDVVVCVPAPYLGQCQATLRGTGIEWGAQDVSAFESGAYTGEVAAGMLRDFGCRYVIVGHSERRGYHGETSATVARKAKAAIAAGLVPIVCVGETLAEREAERTEAVVTEQLDAVLAMVGNVDLARMVVAYEPVWAIGTGRTATPRMAQDVHSLLRGRMAGLDADAAASVRILYGGSMKPENAGELMAMPDIDGGLIGGAALNAADFVAIIGAAG